MDNTEEINDLQVQIEKLQARQAYLKAEDYLVNLCETATYRNELMAQYNDGDPVHTLNMSMYSTMEMLPIVKRCAKYFKDMDESEDWPTWKAEAYKQAKIYDEWKRARGWFH